MFASFDGDYKRQRQINLGGSKNQQSKEELLRKAQLERQKREEERLREKSATALQSFWRSSRCRHAIRNQLRQEWDESYQLVSQRVATLGTDVSDNQLKEILADIQACLGKFHFIYDSVKDHGRLYSMCSLLQMNITLNTANIKGTHSLISIALKESYFTLWKRAITKLLCYCLMSFPKEDGMDPKTGQPSFMLQFLHQVVTIPSPRIQTDLIIELVKQNLFDTCAKFLLSLTFEKKALLSVDRVIKLLQLVLLNISNMEESLKSMCLESFLVDFFSLPALPNRIGLDHLSQFSLSLPFEKLLQLLLVSPTAVIKLSMHPKLSNVDPFAALLCNVLAFGHKRVSMPYIKALNLLLVKTPSLYFSEYHMDDNTTDDDDDEMELDQDIKTPTLLSIDMNCFTKMKKWLDVLFDKAHLVAICKMIKPKSTITEHDVKKDNLLHVSMFIASLTVICEKKKSDIYRSIMYGTDFALIPYLLENDAIVQLFHRDSSPTLFTDGSIVPCVFLAELLHYNLLTMGDDEFYQEKKFANLTKIVHVSGALKDMAFYLWQSDLSKFQKTGLIDPVYIRKLFTKLLQQLYNRDSRKAFCPEDHWLIKSSFFTVALDDYLRSIALGEQTLKNSQQNDTFNDILKHIPFVVPFNTRVTILRTRIHTDAAMEGGGWMAPRARITIRRKHIFEDGFAQLNALGPGLKKRISITFINEQGLEEAGIDGGGVFKEFLTALGRQAFDTNYGLFQATNDQLLYPCTLLYATQETQLQHYEFLGRVLGKALYEGILVDCAFASFFLSKILGKQSYLDDLPSLDQELYQGLIFLKNYEGDVEKDLALNFTIHDQEFGESKTIPLVPNGNSLPVTKENRIRYIYLVANYRLNVQIEKQCWAFFKGLSDLIQPDWLRMFNQHELQILLGGVKTPIDIQDLKRNVVYSGVYDDQYPTIQHLWDVVENDFTEENKTAFVKFVTSCPRPPLLGFSKLQPLFCIRDSGSDEDRLPTASTCMNLLKLPIYRSRSILKEKLLYAIDAAAGFELS